ncbi:MAG TPA: hypothetical protein VGG75_14135 [Trebonia sp.]
MNPAWVAAIVALAGIVATAVGWLLRKSYHAFRTIEAFREDWNGVPADVNHVARPGVLQRVNMMEQTVDGLAVQLSDVQGQVHLNSGHSMRDEVQRIEAAVEMLTGKMDDVQNTVDVLKARP